MKLTHTALLCVSLTFAYDVHAQFISPDSLQAIEATAPVPAESVPHIGTFYSASLGGGPPLPANVRNLPAWNLGDGIWLLDDLNQSSTQMSAMSAPVPGSGGSGGTNTYNYPYVPPPSYSYPTNTTLKWYLNFGQALSAAPVLAPDGTLFISLSGAGSGLWAIDTSAVNTNDPNYPSPSDFTKWVTNGFANFNPSLGADGTVYANGYVSSSPYSVLSACNPTNGALLWYFPRLSPAVIGNDGTIYITDQHTVFALTNALYGTTNYYSNTNYFYITGLTNVGIKWSWSFPNPNYSPFSRMAVGLDGTLYATWSGGLISAFDTNGVLKWTTVPTSTSFIDGTYASSPAIGSDGTVYFGNGQEFYAVNPQGTPTNGILPYTSDTNALMPFKWVWTNSMPGVGGFNWNCKAPVIGSDGTVYVDVIANTNQLVAFDPATGIPKWIVYTPPMNNYSGGIYYDEANLAVAADGEIYLGGLDGTLYSFSPQGTTNWMYATGTEALGAPLIGPDGTIYVQSTGGGSVVYAFAGVSPVACGPWPESYKNSRHTAAAATAQMMTPVMTTNGFQFTMVGPTNLPICPCASSDFTHWTNIGQTTLTAGSTNFVDTAATNYDYRFYRAFPQ